MRRQYFDAGQPSPFDPDFDTSSLFLDSPVSATHLAITTPRVFNVAFRPKDADLLVRPVPKAVPLKSRRKLPYFGHHQLDLDYFPERELFLTV